MRSSSDNPLEIELLEEKATSYFATVKKMQSALRALREFDQAGAGQRSELLAEAAERVWFFLVQREAMRLPFYKTIFADFEIPPEVQARIGPKRSSLPS
jgi:hypothetical protein